MPIPFLQREKSIEELQAENERLNVLYSNEEIRAMIRKAKQKYGVTPKSFGNNLTAFVKWFKSH